MSFDCEALAAAVAAEGRVVRVVVAGTQGSAPRETGTAMLVWQGGQCGTIGGGALEWRALARARQVLSQGRDALERMALGPELAQCCGGAVTLLHEVWDAPRLRGVSGGMVAGGMVAGGMVAGGMVAGGMVAGGIVARALPGRDAAQPLAVTRILARGRDSGQRPCPGIVQGWMVEPVTQASRDLWIWGAGHVGRAIVAVLAPLPDLCLTWIDSGPERFPQDLPQGVTTRAAADPAALAAVAPVTAEHLILTYSHALDLAICHGVLTRGFRSAGLIGSATKWARFRSRLAALGHPDAEILRIACPIGVPALGKHPQAIAVGVAMRLLSGMSAIQSARDCAG